MQDKRPLKLHMEIETWPLIAPFRIAGYTFESIDLLLVRLETEGCAGLGEAAGVYYRNDVPDSMFRQIEALRGVIEAGISRESLQALFPPGGARNALDCALWDLESTLVVRPAWQIAQLQSPKPLLTTFTCGAGEPDQMADVARGYAQARALKIKLTGEVIDVDRIRSVRAARPGVWLGVDANQGFTRESLWNLMPTLLDSEVALIEQPFPVGQEALLDGFNSPIPIAADESVQGMSDLDNLAGRFSVVNIKLDKCGGLTEALAMARVLSARGQQTMVGNMLGTSLAMAPSFLVGQLCKIVDLDGPVFLKADRSERVSYIDGCISCTQSLWGLPVGAPDTAAN